ncbi:hypothetical protein GCM10011428_85340 [Streptomyces violaceus]
MARGKLRIYLGAAPGVGKTYAMLSEAHRRVERGTDCVVAFVEHYDRPRTEVMLHGLEQVPRRTLEYRGGVFPEMDLDAVLDRRPQIALVDELAHTTNVPGSRNAKRWQDVEELLAAGIDVISTVNIQHLESLGDVAESITGVRHGLLLPDPGDRLGDVAEGLQVLDVDGRDHVDARRQQLLHVLPALGVAGAGDVRVGEFVHQGDLGAAVQDGVEVHLGEDAPRYSSVLRGTCSRPCSITSVRGRS